MDCDKSAISCGNFSILFILYTDPAEKYGIFNKVCPFG